MQRLLQSLDQTITQSRIPRELPFLRAERAVIYARRGELLLAREEVAALRALPEAQDSAALSAWLWLAEGLTDFFENMAERSRDRVHRAMALASSIRAPRIHALAAAWLAYLDFRVQDDASMAFHLHLALSTAAPDHHSARARACTVTAGVLRFAGRERLAQAWYHRARCHAMADGDGTALSSIMYDLAVMHVIEARLGECFGARDDCAVRRALLCTESSLFLDRSVGARALRHHPPMLRAQMLTVNGDHAAALELFDRHQRPAMAEGLAHAECLFEADRARCLLALGRGDAARAAARRATSAFMTATEPEVIAIAQAGLARVLGQLGLTDAARVTSHQARETFERLGQRRERLLRELSTVDLERYADPVLLA